MKKIVVSCGADRDGDTFGGSDHRAVVSSNDIGITICLENCWKAEVSGGADRIMSSMNTTEGLNYALNFDPKQALALAEAIMSTYYRMLEVKS